MTEAGTGADLTEDAFLGGRLTLRQPRHGYRAGVDAVLLAASVPARPGQTILDLGCGAGAATLCLAARVQGLTLTGVERHPHYADLARQNAALNGIALDIVTGDLARKPPLLQARAFDHVIANPPYFDRTAGSSALGPLREAAMGEDTPLADWIAVAARRCAMGGHVTVIHRTERLPDLIGAASRHLGSLELLPLIPRAGRSPRMVILRGRKGGRAAFRLHAGWLLHEGDTHPGDRENYTAATSAVLRDGAALPFGPGV